MNGPVETVAIKLTEAWIVDRLCGPCPPCPVGLITVKDIQLSSK